MVDIVKKKRMAEVHSTSGNRRRDALSARRALGDGLLTNQHFPKPLMPWLSTDVLKVGEDGFEVHLCQAVTQKQLTKESLVYVVL